MGVKWLSQRFPWLFNKKKNWSQIMGQFDLLGYCLKCGNGEFGRSRSTRIIRSVLGYNYKYEDKWNRYLHKTEYSVHPLVCNAILELCNRRIDPLISDSLIREVDEIWETLRYRYTGGIFSKGIRCVHLATEICYRLEMEWDGGSGEDNPSGSNSSLWKQNKKVSKALSDYMMYLLVMHPSLLPNNGPLDDGLRFDRNNIILEESDKSRASNLIGNGASDVNAACRYLLSFPYDDWSEMALRLKGKEKPKRWEIIKLIWLGTLRATTRGETVLFVTIKECVHRMYSYGILIIARKDIFVPM
ncbi:hypothetical protein RHGRI_037801 [Rhododendron griersonianum]|uniref:Uncharacterized protein n=1 Tax=Rhododendron griersonianum TaxID=479676 RepID=A0AAV6HYW1_9ERIC|nr:hypothetical protein RHGRI_037801 [Rhododendron griersonianum]